MIEHIDGLVLWVKIPYSLVGGYKHLGGDTYIVRSDRVKEVAGVA
jgi:hypothetical protein